MKIRNGFVSNSSSSSFIVKAEGYFSTVKDVAEYIMQTCKYSDFFDEKITLNNMIDHNTPVSFNTGGDDTYIRKVDDKIVIVTTQNVIFDSLIIYALESDNISKEWFDQFTFKDDYGELIQFDSVDDFDCFYAKFNDFLILKHNFTGVHYYIDNCPHCHSFRRGWKLKNNKIICQCQLDKTLITIRRKEKLIKINEI
jgi:hypothetical protein